MVTTLNFATATMVESIYLQEFSEQTHLVFIEEYRSIVFQAMNYINYGFNLSI